MDSFALPVNHVEYDNIDRFCLPRSQMLKIVFSLNVITSRFIESWIIHQLNYHTHNNYVILIHLVLHLLLNIAVYQ